MRARTLDYRHAVTVSRAEVDTTTERRVSRAPARAVDRQAVLSRLTDKAAERGLRIAYDLLGSRDQAEDAVQEALARACEACHRVRDPEASEAWFYRILTNVCLRALRRRRLRQLFFGRAKIVAEISATPDDTRADRNLARQREITALLGAMDSLPVKQRTALLLRYGHDLSITEIAGMLGVKPATVKTHLVRGLDRLRKIMERQS